MSNITICGVTARPEEHAAGSLPVTTLANGFLLDIPFHVLHGAKSGPRLLLTAVSHGDAITGMEVIRQVMEQLDLRKLSGTLITVPVQNPIGFEWGERNTPIDRYNMNRTYPGNPKGWFTEQMAAAISPLCKEADASIDWHGGGPGTAIHYILISREPGELGRRIREMAFAYGLPYIYDGAPAGPAAAYAGALDEYMTSLGKPVIIAEVGSDMELTFDQIGDSVRGVFNVMKHMGMLEGTPALPEQQYLLHTRPLLRPKNGGMFYPVCGPEYLNKWVPKGTLMAQIINPLTLEVIEEMYAPCEETVFLNMRAGYTKVHPGDYAYILGNRTDATVIENS